jgi:hypothetical protein
MIQETTLIVLHDLHNLIQKKQCEDFRVCTIKGNRPAERRYTHRDAIKTLKWIIEAILNHVEQPWTAKGEHASKRQRWFLKPEETHAQGRRYA